MIFDRTQADIDRAIDIRANKVQKNIELSKSDIAQLERGFLTINTLNSIENKQQELKNLFNSDAYFVKDFENRVWTYTDYFKQADFDRILNNLNKLKKAYFVYSTTSLVSDDNYRRYQTINAVEHILHDLDVMLSDLKSHYRQCGDTECGGE